MAHPATIADDVLYGVEFSASAFLSAHWPAIPRSLAARHIQDRLSGRSGVTITVADRPLNVPGADYSQALFVSMAVDLGRRWLKREGADLLIWGECLPTCRRKNARCRR